MMASAQVVETSVKTNNSPSQDYTTKPDDHSNHNIDSPGFKRFTVIHTRNYLLIYLLFSLERTSYLPMYIYTMTFSFARERFGKKC